MAEVEIYGPPQSTYVRTARMAFEEKGVPYSLQPIEFGSDQHKALHPFGRVPAMKHGDVHLYETLAIATYADLAFDGLKLQPAAPRGRALMMQWTSVVIDYVYQYAVHDVVIERLACRLSMTGSTKSRRGRASPPPCRRRRSRKRPSSRITISTRRGAAPLSSSCLYMPRLGACLSVPI